MGSLPWQYDVIKALPDSVITNPLGLVEEREPKTARRPPTKKEPLDLSAAVSAPLPAKVAPKLATLASTLPTSGDWVTETKLDGYRLLARVDGGRVKLMTRNGHDWTAKFPTLKTELLELEIAGVWLDGETVVPKDGIPSFSALQDAIGGATNSEIVFFLFDLMYLDGQDLKSTVVDAARAARCNPGRCWQAPHV